MLFYRLLPLVPLCGYLDYPALCLTGIVLALKVRVVLNSCLTRPKIFTVFVINADNILIHNQIHVHYVNFGIMDSG